VVAARELIAVVQVSEVVGVFAVFVAVGLLVVAGV